MQFVINFKRQKNCLLRPYLTLCALLLHLSYFSCFDRYDHALPTFANFPAPDMAPSHLLCSSGSHNPSFANTTLHPDFNSMDSARYFAPHLPLEGDRGPVYEFETTTEEYKFLQDGPIPFLDQDVVESIDISLSSMVDMKTLWIIFIALDVLLFVYRVSHTYMNATVIGSGKSYGVESRSGSEALSRSYGFNENNHQYYYTSPNVGDSSNSMYKEQYSKVSTHEYNIPLGTQRVNYNATCNHNGGYPSNGARHNNQYANHDKGILKKVHNKPSEGEDVSNSKQASTYSVLQSAKRTFIKIILSNTLPKVLIGCLVRLLCYITTTTLHTVLSTEYITSTDVLSIYSSGLVSQINQTNWYLSDQARYFNNVSLRIYEGQMKAELTYLEIMLQYFNSGM